MRNAFKIIFSAGILLLHCISTTAQCKVDYGLTDPNTLLITSKSQASENLFFRDHYVDVELGDIYLDVSTGLFIHFIKTLDIRYMDFLVIVSVYSTIKMKHFNCSRLYIEFTDHSGFELKTDTIFRSFSMNGFHYEEKLYYLSNIAFAYLMNKPLYKITVIDDVSDKAITLFPDATDMMNQAKCIADFIPKETSVKQYSKVLDSLIYQKKYGNFE